VSLHALVVDDKIEVAELIAVMFRHSGFETIICHSAADALDAARAETFDVVLSDIGMPRMNGYELARELRKLPEYKDATLIALTGFSMYDDRERSLSAGFNFHLTKPVEADTFMRFITKLKAQR
jgi:CheY-like chemotaxis protein